MNTAKTRMRHGDEHAMIQQAVGLFHACMRRNTTLNQLTGKMPKITDAAAGIRRQSSSHMPIVRCDDLTKGSGDEVKFNLVQPVGAYPVMGSEYAEGRGVGMSLTGDRLRVDQVRFPLDMGDTMTQIREPFELRRLGRPILEMLMKDYLDQSILVHLAGARGFHDRFIEWRIPLEAHERFKKIVINPVRAPTKNRHLVAGGGAVNLVKNNAGELEIATTDTFTTDTVDALGKWIDEVTMPPPQVIFEGDAAATDSPLRVLLVSPAQYHIFSQQKGFRDYQAAAYVRARVAKEHPLFLGEVGLWKGMLIRKMPRPIRFYAGNEIRYCAAYDSQEESVARVPESFGDEFAIDRAILLGGQALGEAFGRADKSGIPFFWNEEERDHGDKMELLIGSILGMSKIRFDTSHGTSHQFTDHGVAVIDTAVPITKGIG